MKKMSQKNKRIVITVTIILVIIIALVVIILTNVTHQAPKFIIEQGTHECDTSAGYTWNNPLGACINERVLNVSQRQAAKVAIAPLSYPVTIIDVKALDCLGCFIVKLQRNDNQNQFQVQLKDWNYSFDCKNYSYSECPKICAICPPCEMCSSLSCNTVEFCDSLGFNYTWRAGIKGD